MIDDLELAFDDRTTERGSEKGIHRRGGLRDRKRRRSGGGKTVIALLLTVVLLGGLGGGVWYGFDRIQGFFGAPDYEGTGTSEVMIEVKSGDLISDIANTLVASDVVKSGKAFVVAAEDNPESKGIQPGFYQVRKQMSAESALGLLLDLKNKVTNKITIPEGKTAKQTFDLLSEATKIPVKDFETAAKDPIKLGVPDFWFKRGDGKQVIKSVEGFLFPDTYEFPPKATAAEMLKMMVAHFNTVMQKTNFVQTVEGDLSVSPFEGLIVASLAQAEAGIPADLGKIARVAYNRAYKKDMPLQFDVTTNYWLEVQGKDTKHSGELLTREMEDPKNPYNTEIVRGLPAGPINSPGQAALEGAASPPDGDFLFFVAVDKTGKSAFATTNEQHDRNIQEACKNGIPLC